MNGIKKAIAELEQARLGLQEKLQKVTNTIGTLRDLAKESGVAIPPPPTPKGKKPRRKNGAKTEGDKPARSTKSVVEKMDALILEGKGVQEVVDEMNGDVSISQVYGRRHALKKSGQLKKD